MNYVKEKKETLANPLLIDNCIFKIYSKMYPITNAEISPLHTYLHYIKLRQHSFVEIDHEIFSTVILSLPLIQEGQLSVSGGRMCTILVNRLED